jgi:hypothetical protein
MKRFRLGGFLPQPWCAWVFPIFLAWAANQSYFLNAEANLRACIKFDAVL